jgi:hypothetical protein
LIRPAASRWTVGRAALAGLDALVAVTAIGGGVALAVGLEAANFGQELLETTPFRSYVGPGAILAVVVGGSAAAATVTVLRRPKTGGLLSIGAGAVLMGWIAGEILLLEQSGEPTPTEVVYLAAGAAMGLLGARVWRAFGRDPGRSPRVGG